MSVEMSDHSNPLWVLREAEMNNEVSLASSSSRSSIFFSFACYMLLLAIESEKDIEGESREERQED
jgi:hypothetical protein